MSAKDRERFGWKIGPSEEVLETSLFHITAARVTNPRNGVGRRFHRLEFTPWVNIIAVTADEQIVLVRQFRFGTETMEWELPGGVVESGEDPLSAAVRELQEETGFVGRDARIIGRSNPNPAIQNNELYTILVEDTIKKAETKMDPMEDITSRLTPVGEVFAMIQSGRIRHAFTHTALLHWLLQSGRLG